MPMLTSDRMISADPPFARVLRRMGLLLITTAVLVGSLTYPFRLQEDVLARLESISQATWIGKLYFGQLRPQLTFGLSPLIYKSSVTAILLLVLASVYVVYRACRGGVESAEREGEANSVGRAGRTRLRRALSDPGLWIVIFIGYSLLRAVAMPSGFPKFLTSFNTPTPSASMKTAVSLTSTLFILLALQDFRPGRRFGRRFMGAVCFAGSLVALIAIVQQTDPVGKRWWFMPPWSDVRNRLGSLIGHNTAVSSWLLFPLSYASFFGLTGRRWWQRWFAWGLVAGCVFVIIAAQSRAIWLIALLGLPAYLYLQLRTLQKRISGQFWFLLAAGFVALVAVQVVAPKYNPFARHVMPLSQRLETQVLNADQLLRETRLRIVAASLPLVAERPILGHGLGAFQWVYPEAQGHWIQKNLFSVFGFTKNRTDVAHNDYLQLVVELGVVGALIAAAALIGVLCRVKSSIRASSGKDRATIYALMFPVVCVGAHALIDFPLHLAAIGPLVCASLGLAAGAQWWVRESRSIVSTAAVAPSQIVDVESATFTAPPRFRASKVAGLSAAGIVLMVSVLSGFLMVRGFLSDVYFADGSNSANTVANLPKLLPLSSPYYKQQNLHFLEMARKSLRSSIHLDPYNGEAYEKLAYTYFQYAGYWERERREAEAKKDASAAEAARVMVQSSYESAFEISRNQLLFGELRWHYTYYLIANAYLALYKLSPDPADIRQMNYLSAARANAQRALDFNLADTPSLLTGAQVFSTEPGADEAAAARLRGLIHFLDPSTSWAEYVAPAISLADHGQFADAEKRLLGFQKDVEKAKEPLPPSERRERLIEQAICFFLLQSATWPPPALDTEPETTATKEFRRARGTTVYDRMSDLPPRNRLMAVDMDERINNTIAVRTALVLGNMERASAAARTYLQHNPNDPEMQVIEYVAATQSNQPLPKSSPDFTKPRYARFVARMEMLYFGNKTAAARLLADLANRANIVLEVGEGLRAADLLRRAGDWVRFAMVAANLKKNNPRDKDVAKLVQDAMSHVPAEALTSGSLAILTRKDTQTTAAESSSHP